MNAPAQHMAALSRLYGPTAGELHNALLEAATHQLDLVRQLNPRGDGAESRIDALLAQAHGFQKTALRLRALLQGAADGRP